MIVGLLTMVVYVFVSPRDGASWWLTCFGILSTVGAMGILDEDLRGLGLRSAVVAAICWTALYRLEKSRPKGRP
jgi:hypothetical protein